MIQKTLEGVDKLAKTLEGVDKLAKTLEGVDKLAFLIVHYWHCYQLIVHVRVTHPIPFLK